MAKPTTSGFTISGLLDRSASTRNDYPGERIPIEEIADHPANAAYSMDEAGIAQLAKSIEEEGQMCIRDSVTFEPGCRNNWHVHNADKGGGQMLICVGGRGYYQEWGQPAQEMLQMCIRDRPRRSQSERKMRTHML